MKPNITKSVAIPEFNTPFNKELPDACICFFTYFSVMSDYDIDQLFIECFGDDSDELMVKNQEHIKHFFR